MLSVLPNWVVVILALLAGAIFIAVVSYVYGSVETSIKVNQKIDRQNNDAIRGANKGELDFLSCHSGWLYDFGTQKCVKSR